MLKGHAGGITSCAWSPGGDVIATGSRDVTVCLWDPNTLEPLRVFEHPANGEIRHIEFSLDGRWVLTRCFSFSSSFYVWDLEAGTGRPVNTPRYSNATAATFGPSSTRLATASTEDVVEIMERDSGDWEPGPVVIESSGHTVGRDTRHIVFSPDGNRVLTVPNFDFPTHVMKLWDAHTGVELLPLAGHTKQICMVCFSPCGRYVASASKDGTVRLWRTSDGSCIVIFTEHKGKVEHVRFSSDGKALVSGGWEGSVIIRQMCNILPRDEQYS